MQGSIGKAVYLLLQQLAVYRRGLPLLSQRLQRHLQVAASAALLRQQCCQLFPLQQTRNRSGCEED